jgi:hypothetical protein
MNMLRMGDRLARSAVRASGDHRQMARRIRSARVGRYFEAKAVGIADKPIGA